PFPRAPLLKDSDRLVIGAPERQKHEPRACQGPDAAEDRLARDVDDIQESGTDAITLGRLVGAAHHRRRTRWGWLDLHLCRRCERREEHADHERRDDSRTPTSECFHTLPPCSLEGLVVSRSCRDCPRPPGYIGFPGSGIRATSMLGGGAHRATRT